MYRLIVSIIWQDTTYLTTAFCFACIQVRFCSVLSVFWILRSFKQHLTIGDIFVVSFGYNFVLAVALVLVLVYFDLLLNYFPYIRIFIYNKYISTEWVNTHGDTSGLSYGEDNFTSADARMHSQLSLLERQWRNIIKYLAKWTLKWGRKMLVQRNRLKYCNFKKKIQKISLVSCTWLYSNYFCRFTLLKNWRFIFISPNYLP